MSPEARVRFAVAALMLAVSAGAQDHPLIPVYPGSKLDERKVLAFDEFKLPVGKVWDGKFSKELPLEGRITRLKYSNPEERSTLEMFRNYQTALKQSGFTTVFSCGKEECGSGYVGEPVGQFNAGTDMRYIVAKLARPEGDVYAAINVSAYYHDTWITVVEVKPMDETMSGRTAASPEPAAPRVPASAAVSAEETPVRVISSRSGTRPVVAGVIKGLSRFGIQAKAGSASEKADIVVEGDVTTDPFQGSDARIKWARSNANITLRDGRTSKVFAQFTVSAKGDSRDYNESVRRSHEELSKKVAARVDAEIDAYFENQ